MMSAFEDDIRSLVTQLVDKRRNSDVEVSSDVWKDIVELGLVDIGVPEDEGGAGGGFDDLVVVSTELARSGLATPFVEAAITSRLTEGHADTIPDAIAIASTGVEFSEDTATGEVVVWCDPVTKHLLLVDDTAVRIVDLDQISVGRTPTAGTVALGLARIRLDRTPTRIIGADSDDVLARLGILRAASILGAGLGAFELTRSYVHAREQFGAPLIKVAAVAANLAKMRTELDQAGAALERAVQLYLANDSTSQSRRDAATIARVTGSTVATFVARQSHQLHGALGVAAEYPLGKFTRMLWAWRDSDESELNSTIRLGERALTLPEAELWDLLTG